MAHEDPRVKSAAFGVYAIADKDDAVQYVSTLLKNPTDSVRRIGLSLIPQLDYPSAEPLLWWMLAHETNVELQDQVGYMVAANPTRDGIIKMFVFCHDKNGEIKDGFAEMWSATLISAESTLGMRQHDIEESCWVAIVSEQKSEQEKEKSDYKFNSVVGEKDDIVAEIDPKSISRIDDNPLEKLLIHIYENKVKYIGGVCVFCALFLFLYLNADSGRSNNSKPLTRKNKDVVVSETSFVADEEIPEVKSQIGTKDWVEGIKSNAGAILSSPRYSATILKAQKEQDDYRKEAEKAEKDYFTKIANDKSASLEERNWAQANLNENYKKGIKEYKAGNYRDALMSLEAAANDPTLNSYSKCEIMQKIAEIYSTNNDKENWNKWMDRFFKEMMELPEFKKMKELDAKNGNVLSNFSQNMNNLEGFSNQLKNNPEMIQRLASEYKKMGYNDKEAKEAVNGLMDFKHPFELTK